MLCCFTGTHVALFDWYTCCVVLLVRMLCCLTVTQVVLWSVTRWSLSELYSDVLECWSYTCMGLRTCFLYPCDHFVTATILALKKNTTVMSFWTDRSGQTMQTQIRLLLLDEQSDQSSLFFYSISIFLTKGPKIWLLCLNFRLITAKILGARKFRNFTLYMRKHDFCICDNKDTDQLLGYQ